MVAMMASPPDMEKPDYIKNILQRRVEGLPDNWAIGGWTRIGQDATAFRIASCRVLTRGKNKGQKRWGKTTHTCVVTDEEEYAERMRYETETGNCSTCGGMCIEWVGWHRITGHKYQKCGRCAGSGKVPVPLD